MMLLSLREIENLMHLKEPVDKIKMFWTFLKDQGLTYFEHHLKRIMKVKDSDLSDNGIIELVIRDYT
jgi:hypothetical protein